MKITPFKLEEFWKKYEFTTPYLLCGSDAESWKLHEILELADDEMKELWSNLSLGYTEPPGHPLLRQEISKLYKHINAEKVFTFAGAEEGIYCAMRTLINPGDHVVAFEPCYQSLRTLPETFGAEVTSIPLRAENQWQLDLDEVKKAFRPTTKLLVLNFPHNPTGIIPTRAQLDGLIQLARKSGAYILCDEVYRHLEPAEMIPAIADAYKKGISLNVMTKSFGLAGLRIGWLASKDRVFMEQVGSYKLYTSICNSAPSEVLAIIALRAKETIWSRNREILLYNLNYLEAFMKRHPQKLSWVRPQGGTLAILKLLLPIPIEKFMEDLVVKAGILIMPGSVFDLPGNYFRVGFGKKDMPSILDRFEKFIKN